MELQATSRLSTKRQITLPARMVRSLGLEAGAVIILRLEGDRIVLLPAPESYTESLGGSLEGVYGDADEYVREERASWTQS